MFDISERYQFTLFFYKNNLIRTKALILAKKNYEHAKNKGRLAIPQNIRTKCLG